MSMNRFLCWRVDVDRGDDEKILLFVAITFFTSMLVQIPHKSNKTIDITNDVKQR